MPSDRQDYIGGTVTMPSLVYRGDPSGYDFEGASFPIDGTVNDLDLSAIVPVGAIAALCRVTLFSMSVYTLELWRKGDTGNFSKATINPNSDSAVVTEELHTLFLNSNRFISSQGSNVSYAVKQFTVLGWFI